MVTIEQLYRALRAHGASQVQAAGITGNSVSEVGPSTSDLSPDSELNQMYYEDACMCLWCWTTPYYDPPRPTGDVAVDLDRQIDYLRQTGGFDHADGPDATAAGRNFALNYERCAECFVDGEQYIARGNQAAAVARLAAAYGWDDPPHPVKSMHYERYRPGGERTAAERYDVWRDRERLTPRERGWLSLRRRQCALYRRRIELAVAWDGGHHVADPWSQDERRFRHAQLGLRAAGKRVEPS